MHWCAVFLSLDCCGDQEFLEELTLQLAGAVTAALRESVPSARSPSPADERRVAQAARRIQAEADKPVSLTQMASDAAMSPYHFLRTFRQVAGMTPYQVLLFTRLRRAAVRLRRTTDTISMVAIDAGFNDLSTFNRRFRQVMGISQAYFGTTATVKTTPQVRRRNGHSARKPISESSHGQTDKSRHAPSIGTVFSDLRHSMPSSCGKGTASRRKYTFGGSRS